eukprot:scaffold125622_cov51-Phaeocystis_antarctica.AAC.1
MALQLPGGEQLHVRRSQLRLALAAAEGPSAAPPPRVVKRGLSSSSSSSSSSAKRRAPAPPPERGSASAAPLGTELARAAMAKAAAIAAAAEVVQAEAATEMAAVAVALSSPSQASTPSPSPPPQRPLHPQQRPPCTGKTCSTPSCTFQDNHLGGHSTEIADTRQLSPALPGSLLASHKRRKRSGAVGKNALLRSQTSQLVLAPLSPHVVGWETFSQLPPAEMQRLSHLLPEIDQPAVHWAQAMRCEQLADGVRLWQMQLSTGEFEVGCEEARKVYRGQAIRKEARQAEGLQARLREALQAQGSKEGLAFLAQMQSVAERAAADNRAHAASSKAAVDAVSSPTPLPPAVTSSSSEAEASSRL